MRLLQVVFVSVAALLLSLDTVSASVCTKKTSTVRSTKVKSGTRACGWWNWSRCTNYKQTQITEYNLVNECCPGDYGYVDTGCTGECAYDSEALSSDCQDDTSFSRICRDYTCDKSGFSNTPIKITINENDNDAILVWPVRGTTFIQGRSSGRTSYSDNVPVTNCTVRSTNGIMEVRNGLDIYRRACMNPTCRQCGASDIGCLDHNVNYEVKVTCYADGYKNNGNIDYSFVLDIEAAEQVQFEFPDDVADTPITVVDLDPGSVVLQLDDVRVPGNEEVSISLHGPVSNITGEPFFEWNEGTQEVLVVSDLSLEPPGEYTVKLCALQRRGMSCTEFTVIIEEKTTTTTTTTTTTPTTTTTEPEIEVVRACIARTPWDTIKGFDAWCETICGPLENCPYFDYCLCDTFQVQHLVCHARGVWQSVYMDAWCQLNCNYGEYSYCPSEEDNPSAFCECDDIF